MISSLFPTPWPHDIRSERRAEGSGYRVARTVGVARRRMPQATERIPLPSRGGGWLRLQSHRHYASATMLPLSRLHC